MKNFRFKFFAVVAALSIGFAAFCQIPDYYYPVKEKREFKAAVKLTGGVTGAVAATGAVSGATVASTGAATVGTTLGVTGASTLAGGASVVGGIATDSLSSSGIVTGTKSIITVTTDTALTLAQCRGTVILVADAAENSTVTLTIPSLATGMNFTVIDMDNNAGADVEVQMGEGDAVNGGTAGKMLKHVSTSTGAARFVAATATALEYDGAPTDASAWTNDNN